MANSTIGQSLKITAVQRPFVLTFHGSGSSYPLTAEECQRLLDSYPAGYASQYRVVLPGHNLPWSRAEERCTLQPATRGGGPAFIIERMAGGQPDRPDTLAENNVPNLDGMPADDLWAFWKLHNRPSRAAVLALFPNRQPGDRAFRATKDLACYASNKATAMACQLRGDINTAKIYEDIADRIYRDLPGSVKW